MKLKELESYLSQCEPFANPKVVLEQYATSAHIAARMIFAAQDKMQGTSFSFIYYGWHFSMP